MIVDFFILLKKNQFISLMEDECFYIDNEHFKILFNFVIG
jgi:hypothetical protein